MLTPYITPSMNFYSRKGVVRWRRGQQLEFALSCSVQWLPLIQLLLPAPQKKASVFQLILYNIIYNIFIQISCQARRIPAAAPCAPVLPLSSCCPLRPRAVAATDPGCVMLTQRCTGHHLLVGQDDPMLQRQIQSAVPWAIEAVKLCYADNRVKNYLRALYAIRSFTGNLVFAKSWHLIKSDADAHLQVLGEELAKLYASLPLHMPIPHHPSVLCIHVSTRTHAPCSVRCAGCVLLTTRFHSHPRVFSWYLFPRPGFF